MTVTPVVLGGLLTEYRVTEIAVLIFDRMFVAHNLMHMGCPGILRDEVTIGCWAWIVVWIGVVVSPVDLSFQPFDPVGDLSGHQFSSTGFHGCFSCGAVPSFWS